jgi:hypothetical protein
MAIAIIVAVVLVIYAWIAYEVKNAPVIKDDE